MTTQIAAPEPAGFMDGLRALTDRLKGFVVHDEAQTVDKALIRKMIANTKEVLRGGDMQVPVFPGPAQQIMSMLNDPNASIDELVSCIETDTSMSAQTLRVANSAAYSGGTQILSIKRAISHLGLQRMRTLLFTMIRNNLFPTGANKHLHTAYFQQAMAVATAAEVFGPILKIRCEHRFLYGVLHNIGRSCMLNVINQMQRSGQLPKDLDDATTRTIINATYKPCGTILALRWKLPNDFQEVIRFHKYPEEASSPFFDSVLLTHMALLLCTTWGAGYARNDLQSIFQSPYIMRLKISPIDIDEAARETLKRYDTLVSSFA